MFFVVCLCFSSNARMCRWTLFVHGFRYTLHLWTNKKQIGQKTCAVSKFSKHRSTWMLHAKLLNEMSVKAHLRMDKALVNVCTSKMLVAMETPDMSRLTTRFSIFISGADENWSKNFGLFFGNISLKSMWILEKRTKDSYSVRDRCFLGQNWARMFRFKRQKEQSVFELGYFDQLCIVPWQRSSPSLLNLLSLVSCFSHRYGSTVLNFSVSYFSVFLFRSKQKASQIFQHKTKYFFHNITLLILQQE